MLLLCPLLVVLVLLLIFTKVCWSFGLLLCCCWWWWWWCSCVCLVCTSLTSYSPKLSVVSLPGDSLLFVRSYSLILIPSFQSARNLSTRVALENTIRKKKQTCRKADNQRSKTCKSREAEKQKKTRKQGKEEKQKQRNKKRKNKEAEKHRSRAKQGTRNPKQGSPQRKTISQINN